MKQKIGIIDCPANRCSDCSNKSENECQKLALLCEKSDNPILILEAERGLLHIWLKENNYPSGPPWCSEEWESVFIGINDSIFNELNDLIDAYFVGPYLALFLCENNGNRIRYLYRPIVRTSLELSLLKNLLIDNRVTHDIPIGIREKIAIQQERIIYETSQYIHKHIPELNEGTRNRLSQIAAHSTSTFGPLIPILLDELTEEVYLDGPDTPIYFDHQKYGRCTTSIEYGARNIPRIITFLRSESNLHLDRSNPSIKMELDFLDMVFRLSASVPPLCINGLSLEIRRARKKPYTIKNLIENGTVSLRAAALLILSVVSRLNITITGEPGTGKTTLLNALDMITPRWWRKIYIEDATESRFLKNQHQVRLQVDPVDEHHAKLSKSDEIVKCLHRSPDYLILGEIQTAEHSKALFQAMSAGLRSIQTCHSNSASSLISRWVLGHGIERSNLGMMDLIVSLERPKPGDSKRHIKEIVEIRKGVEDGFLVFLGTNTLYHGKDSDTIEFANDGTFQNLAASLGIDDYKRTIDSLVDSISNFSNLDDFEKLSDYMWSYGHPMKFVGRKST